MAGKNPFAGTRLGQPSPARTRPRPRGEPARRSHNDLFSEPDDSDDLFGPPRPKASAPAAGGGGARRGGRRPGAAGAAAAEDLFSAPGSSAGGGPPRDDAKNLFAVPAEGGDGAGAAQDPFADPALEADPFEGTKPAGVALPRVAPKHELSDAGLDDPIDPDDPFGIGNKPVPIRKKSTGSGGFDLFAVVNDFDGGAGRASPARSTGADRRGSSSGTSSPRPATTGGTRGDMGAAAVRRAKTWDGPRPESIEKSRSTGASPAVPRRRVGTVGGDGVTRAQQLESVSPSSLFRPPDPGEYPDPFKDTLVMRDWFDDDGGVGDALGGAEADDAPILEVLRMKLEQGLITQAEYDKCYVDHMVTNKLSPVREAEDWSSDGPYTGHGLTAEQRRIFEMPERERLRVMDMIKRGITTYDEAMACIEQGNPVTASSKVRTSEEIRNAAMLSAGDPVKLPLWLTRTLACDELVKSIEAEAEATSKLMAVEARLEEAERALDNAEAAKVLAQSRMARAEAENAIRQRALRESDAQLNKAQNTLIALRQRVSKADFDLASMSVRNRDLSEQLKRVQTEVFEARSMVEVMGYIKEIADKNGIDLRDLSAAGREDKVRMILHRIASSEMAKTVDQALGGPEVTEILNALSDRMGRGDAPNDIATSLLTSGDLAKVLNALARDGMFGPRGRAFAEAGSFDRLCDRVGQTLVNERLNELVRVAAGALGSTTPNQEVIRLVRDPAMRAKVVAAAEEGLFGPQAQRMARSGGLKRVMERVAAAMGADAVRGAFDKVRQLSADGSLLLVTQFAGDSTPLGQAAQRVSTFVTDGSLDWLEQLVCTQIETIIGGAAEAVSGQAGEGEGQSAGVGASAGANLSASEGTDDAGAGGAAAGGAAAGGEAVAAGESAAQPGAREGEALAAAGIAAAAVAAARETTTAGGEGEDGAPAVAAGGSDAPASAATAPPAAEPLPAQDAAEAPRPGHDGAEQPQPPPGEAASGATGTNSGSEEDAAASADGASVVNVPDIFGFD